MVTSPFYPFADALASPLPAAPPGTIAAMDVSDSDDLRLLERAEAELEDVDRALARLEDGSYGICEACGGPIGDERLARVPVTRRCARHAPPPTPDLSTGT